MVGVPDIGTRFLKAFSEDEVWAHDRWFSCGTPNAGCLQVLDTSSLTDTEIENRQHALFPFGADSPHVTNDKSLGTCGNDDDCCLYQWCDAGTCKGLPLRIDALTRGPSSEYFALVSQSPNSGNFDGVDESIGPNTGIYVLNRDASYTTTSLRGAAPILTAGQTPPAPSCAVDDIDLTRVTDILWSHGTLYLIGEALWAMRASDPNSGDYMQWGVGGPTQFKRVDPPLFEPEPGKSWCGREMLASGRYLYTGHGELDSADNDGNCNPTDQNWFDNLDVFDISDPMNPVHLSTLELRDSGHGMTLVGNLLYITQSQPDRVLIVDMTDRLNPSQVGSYTLPGFNRNIDVWGTHLFINTEENGARALDGR
jgi:hypothetical protein